MELNQLIATGDEAIHYAKNILRYGAGNIIEDIRKTDSESLGRSDYARELYSEASENCTSEIERIYLRAAAAKVAQGGNCHEHAALVFARLMETTKGLKIQMCRQRMVENKKDYHVFIRIFTSTIAIVVDAWGSNNRAYSYRDEDCQEKIIIIHEAVTSGKGELFYKSDAIIRQTENFKCMEYRLEEASVTNGNCFKTFDNLEYLEEDKYIGGRGKRAYNDPGLN